MKYVQLKKHIYEKKFDPAYYFTGSDEYLKSWSIKMFCGAAGNADVNYARLDGSDDGAVVSALELFPMAGGLRVVVVDVFPSEFTRLAAYFRSPSPTSVLIILGFSDKGAAKKKQELEQLKKGFTEIDCNPLDHSMLRMWIANEVSKADSEISPSAAELLIDYTKGDLSRISGELAKLASLRSGELISDVDVRSLVAPGEDYKIWELSAAVAERDRARAMKIAEKFEADKIDFVMLFGAVYKHFHNMFFMLCSDETDAMTALDLTSYSYNKLFAGAKKFGTRKLKNILYALSELDFASKSGRLDKSLAARTMITAIIDAL